MPCTARNVLLGLLAVVCLIAYGCGTTVLTANYAGSKIRPGYEIAIQPGEHLGDYQSDDLAIKYQYTSSPAELKIRGKVEFAAATQLNFTMVDYFNLSLLLGNSQNQILSHHGLISTSWVNLTSSNNQVSFSQTIKLPPDAAVMAFSYTGQASEGGAGDAEDGGSNAQFWQYPIIK